jgi:hypothetical protein
MSLYCKLLHDVLLEHDDTRPSNRDGLLGGGDLEGLEHAGNMLQDCWDMLLSFVKVIMKSS